MFSVQRDRINTLRVRTAGEVKPAVRLAIKNEISQLQLTPHGMPPSAVLLVRRLQTPRVSKHVFKERDDNVWGQGVRDQLQEAYRNAVRPTGSGVSGDPSAILFRDQAELLSCLVLDIYEQRVGKRWWWRSQRFSSVQVSQRIRDVLLNDARYFPAVISQLINASKALGVIKKIEPQHAMEILYVVLKEFSLNHLWWSMTMAESVFSKDISKENSHEKINIRQRNQQQALLQQAVPPWASLFSDEVWREDLGREQAALLGVAYTLQQRPTVMRNRIFQRSLAEWWADASTKTDTGLRADAQSERGQLNNYARPTGRLKKQSNEIVFFNASSTQNNSTGKGEKNISGKHTGQVGFPSSRETIDTELSQKNFTATDWYNAENLGEYVDDIAQKKNRPKHITEWDGERNRTPVEKHADSIEKPNKVSQFENQREKMADDFLTSEERANGQYGLIANCAGQGRITAVDEKLNKLGNGKSSLAEEILENNDEVSLHFSDTFIDTRLGGVIFLINLLQQMGLPKSFNEDWTLDQQLSPWAMLDLLARALLGKQFESFYLDPIWRILAKLDGRATKLQIAKKFVGHKNYRIPQDWYTWLDVDQVYWGTFRKALRIWTPACVLVETAFEGDSFERCLGEMQRYDPDFTQDRLQPAAYGDAPLEVRSHLQEKGINLELARFLALVTPFVREFMWRQLNMNKASKRELVREVLQLDARIYLSSSHIDLVTGIDNTRFTLRCAGLDQNPGWLPEYGRVVLIHFS